MNDATRAAKAAEPFRFVEGTTPLLVSIPHAGLTVPDEVRERFTEAAQPLPDTDWHVDRLYDFLSDLGATVIAANYSRYLIDLNRPADGAPLYPGAPETGLCPTTTFACEKIYRDGAEPDSAEVARRRERYWQPYHDRLARSLATLKTRHGRAVLWDAHSIASRVPRFFDDRLPDLNLGTRDGASADPLLIARQRELLEAAAGEGFSSVVDGRFKGGHITRHYGRPDDGVHALQLELSQITYMDEAPPYGFREDLAQRVRPVLRRLLECALVWADSRM